MEKMIFRTQPCWAFSSKLIDELYIDPKPGYDTLKSVVDQKGYEYTIKSVCEDELSYSQLCEEFDRFVQSGTSELFSYAFQLNKNYAVSIDSNIYLYRFSPDDILEQQSVFRWCYASVRKYVGDTWWYDDEEILSDIRQLPLLEFLDKYKGYVG